MVAGDTEGDDVIRCYWFNGVHGSFNLQGEQFLLATLAVAKEAK